MAHTPGPWRVSECRSITAQFEREEVQIASMSRSSWSFPNGGKNVRLAAQMDANARLIAAAPELLEACKEALKAFESNACIDWSLLSTAILKAEGVKP